MSTRTSTSVSPEDFFVSLRSATITNAHTLDDFKTLLGVKVPVIKESNQEHVSVAGKSALSKKSAMPGVTKTKSRSNTKKAVSFEVYETSQNRQQPLAPKERHRLAIKAFNLAIKCLTDVARAQNGVHLHTAPGEKAGNIVEKKVRPLQTSSPNTQRKENTSKCIQHYVSPDTDLVSDCAIIALDCLRELEPQNAIGEAEHTQTLDKGALILVEKLISLRQTQKALQETSKLYEQFWKRRKGGIDSEGLKNQRENVELHTLLICDADAQSETDIGFVSSYQSQVLRLAILTGSKAVTQELLGASKPIIPGSPTDIILRGLAAGHISMQKAGEQLRTIAQALLKLYSISISGSGTNKPAADLNINLLVEALTIKSKAWKLIGYTPDLHGEFWKHISKGIARFEMDRNTECDTAHDLVFKVTQQAKAALEANSFEKAIPADIINAATDIAERNSHYREALDLLEKYQEDLTHMSSTSNMLYAWRVVTLMSKCYDTRSERLLWKLETAAISFAGVDELKTRSIDDVLLHGARFRKAVLTILQDTSQSAAIDLSTGLDYDRIRCCLNIFQGLIELLRPMLRVEAIDISKEQQKAAVTGFAKTFEALLEASDKHLKTPALLVDCDSRLSHCIDLANAMLKEPVISLETQETYTFINSLLVRVSRSYWRRYSERTIGNITEQCTITLLQSSCRALSQLPLQMQQSATYGPKLERLALAYSTVNQVLSARQTFEEAISHYIALGALNEAVEAALSGSSLLVWSKNSTMSYSLGKSLLSLAKLQLSSNNGGHMGSKWIFDRESLPPVQRCVLFEAQLAAGQDHEFSLAQSSELVQYLRFILQLCDNIKLQVYRLRLFGHLLRFSSRNTSLSEEFSEELHAHAHLLHNTPNMSKETLLSSYAPSLYHLVFIQWLMYGGTVDIKQLQKHMKSLSLIVLDLSDRDALEASIDDISHVLNQLQAVFMFGRMIDNIDIMLPCLLTMRHILMIQGSEASPRLAETLTNLAVLYNRLSDTAQAGRAFALAEQVFAHIPEQSLARTRCLLFYVEYLLNLSNATKAMEVYEQANACFKASTPQKKLPGREQLDRDSVLSKAALVASQIATELGILDTAVHFARQAVKLSSHIWQTIENAENHRDSNSICISDTSIPSLINDMSSLVISSEVGSREHKHKGSLFWKYLDLHFSALHLMASLSIHVGLFQDAQYYSEQQNKVARAIGSHVHIGRASAFSALIHAKAGVWNETVDAMRVSGSLSGQNLCFEDYQQILHRAETLLETGHIAEATLALDCLASSPIRDEVRAVPERGEEKGIKKAPVRGKAKALRPIIAPAKRSAVQNPKATEGACDISTNSRRTRSQQYVCQKSQAIRNDIELLLGNGSELNVREPTDKMTASKSTDIGVTNAKMMLHQALAELSSDAVKCVLAETAVALPVRYRSSRKSGRVSFVQGFIQPINTKPTKPGHRKDPTSKAVNAKTKFSTGEQLIVDAQQLLRQFQSKQTLFSPSDMIHTAYKLNCRVGLLSSTIGAPLALSSAELVLQTLMPKNIVQGRERATIHAERATRDKAQLLSWPEIPFSTKHTSHNSIYDCSLDNFNDIPQTWSILTISLSDDQQELLLSKIASGRSPFLVRVPLSRSDVEIDGADEFSFAEAKAELLDIIENANTSAHDPRGQGDRETRKAWYAERESLDTRLETWLSNIQSLWLGGFRGLMSSNTYDDELLAKFGQKINLILDKHLPSRQKSGQTKGNKVALHAHVLELFLGLGHPDAQELDDATTDLLYFVVDILQFSGEHNAYDEIDFDAILVDVFDAMRGFYGLQTQVETLSQHTILVVDKELAAFPWESLPCFKERFVSRMPSLSSIMHRVKKMRHQSQTAEAYSISASQGAYMLNPSSDLTSTQAMFEPILRDQLPDFTSTVNKKPTEFEFSSMLSDNQLFLYFGHGSGAQYIRGRTIRNLDTCAVTLLMGCSSAKMTECGKFESYGMPGYYMGGMSNCMAVVGTLWDVTDRDIDRFAMRTLVEWGLLEEDESVKRILEKATKSKGTTNRKGKEKKVTVSSRRGLVTLDNAVQKGRDACLLRYLNGAAPVVYGVPVCIVDNS